MRGARRQGGQAGGALRALSEGRPQSPTTLAPNEGPSLNWTTLRRVPQLGVDAFTNHMSGLTMTGTSLQQGYNRSSTTQKARSSDVSLGFDM